MIKFFPNFWMGRKELQEVQQKSWVWKEFRIIDDTQQYSLNFINESKF